MSRNIWFPENCTVVPDLIFLWSRWRWLHLTWIFFFFQPWDQFFTALEKAIKLFSYYFTVVVLSSICFIFCCHSFSCLHILVYFLLSWHISVGLLSSKEPACNSGDPGSIPVLGRSPGEGHGNPPSIFAWRILWTEEPGGLWSVEL